MKPKLSMLDEQLPRGIPSGFPCNSLYVEFLEKTRSPRLGFYPFMWFSLAAVVTGNGREVAPNSKVRWACVPVWTVVVSTVLDWLPCCHKSTLYLTSTKCVMASNIVAGKIAFVTGAGSGIGKATCRILSREGAKVIATDRNLKAAEQTASFLEGSGHLAIELDVSELGNVESAFKKCKQHFSDPPTIIVNSAGITRDNFLLKISEEDFDEVLKVNLKGTFCVVRTAANGMIEAGVSEGGSIINLSSIIGKIGNIGQCNYSASKAGVVALTRTAAMEFGKFGIRVNAVLPATIETPMIASVPDKVKEIFIGMIPLKRMGKPEEVAEVIAFLASEKSSYVNGASIEVTGGL